MTIVIYYTPTHTCILPCVKMYLVRALPKPSKNYDFFCAFIGVVETLETRGYNIPEEYLWYISRDASMKEKYETYIDVHSKTIKVPYEQEYVLNSDSESEYPSPLTVCILNVVENATYVDSLFIKAYKGKPRKDELHVLAVHDVPKDYSKVDVGNGSLEIMCYQQLIINPIYHSRAPLSVTKLTKEEKNKLLNREVMNDKELVRILPADSMCLFMGARYGDVLKYVDAKVYTEQGLSTVEYKMVGR